MYDTLWSTPRRKAVTSIITTITAALGIITAWPTAMEAWDGQGMPTFATRGWTRVQMADYKGIRMDIATGKREAAEGRLDQLELDLLKTMSEEEKIKNLQAQRRQKDTIEKLKDQIKTIEQAK